MVAQFLPFGGLCTKQRAAAYLQIKTLVEKIFVHKKVFLFGAYGGQHRNRLRVAQGAQHAQRLPVQHLDAAQQWRFLVQRFACVGTEGGGDIQCGAQHKGGACRVPRGVAARLKGGAQPARGKR